MADDCTLSFGPYRLDPANARLWRETQPVRLTPKAFQVLCYVVERAGQLVSKDELFGAVWADTVISDATLTSAIQEIRRALQDNPREPQYLETVPKRGFRFIGKVVSSQQSVVSSEDAVSSQQSVVSREKGSLDDTLRLSSGQTAAGIQEFHAEALDESPWIPASAGMTPLPFSPRNDVNGEQEPAPVPFRPT